MECGRGQPGPCPAAENFAEEPKKLRKQDAFISLRQRRREPEFAAPTELTDKVGTKYQEPEGD